MSLTINQQPAPCHGIIYPEYYSINSTNYADDYFRYMFNLNVLEGNIANSIIQPSIEAGLGYYDSNIYVKNLFGNDFQPTIIQFTNCPNSIKQYRIDVDEINGGGDSDVYTKKIALKCYKKDFDYLDYILKINLNTGELGKFLTDINNLVRDVNLTDNYGTVRFLSGMYYRPSTISRVYEMLVKRTRGLTTTYYISVNKNPYYTQTTNGYNSNNLVLEDMSNYLLEFPCAPRTLNIMKWKRIGYEVGGTYFSIIDTSTYSNILAEGDTYSIQTNYGGTNSPTSNPLYFNVMSCGNQIQIYWENDLGAYDFYNFNKVFYKSYKVDRFNFEKNPYRLENNEIVTSSTDRGTTNYRNEITTQYTVNSDWLQGYELEEIESIFYSKSMYAQIDGIIYPIISKVDEVEIKTNRHGLKNIQFSFILSNKKYI